MIDLLLILLKPGLLCLSNPKRYWYMLPLLALAWVVDMLANWTTLSLVTGDGFPRRGEWTFSQRLPRLCRTAGPDMLLYIEIAMKLNRIDPLHTHIEL